MIYEVHLEAKVEHYASIEANSPEEAAKIALRDHAIQTVQVTLRPTFLEEKEKAKNTGELSMEVIGICSKCDNGIVSREIPGQPWVYRHDDNEHDPKPICYPCAIGPVESLARLA